jgi:hypothetical protein
LREFMLSYDKFDSDYIFSLAVLNAVEFKLEFDEDYLYIG